MVAMSNLIILLPGFTCSYLFSFYTKIAAVEANAARCMASGAPVSGRALSQKFMTLTFDYM